MQSMGVTYSIKGLKGSDRSESTPRGQTPKWKGFYQEPQLRLSPLDPPTQTSKGYRLPGCMGSTSPGRRGVLGVWDQPRPRLTG